MEYQSKNININKRKSRGYKEVHNFAKCIRPKVNVIALQEFELAHYDVTV